MQTIKINFEYGAFPVWIYDDEGNFIENSLPSYLLKNEELQTMFDNLQIKYDSLFIDNPTNFEYKGFESKNAESEFYKQVQEAKEKLNALNNGSFVISK